MRKRVLAFLLVLVLGAVGALVSCSPKKGAVENFTVGDGQSVKVGIFSDTQLASTPNDDGYQFEQNLYRALSYYKAKGVDAIMFAGDLSDLASEYAYDSFNRVWNNVFEAYKSGKEPIKLFVMGNHDYWAPKGEVLTAAGAQNRFMKKLGESPWSHKVINGYHFISCSADGGAYTGTHKSNAEWLEEQIKIAEKDNSTRPIFVETHYNPQDTMYGSDEWGTDVIGDIFARHYNVVSFSGHSHYALADERSIWQAENGGYTAIQTQCLSYVELESGKQIGRTDLPAEKYTGYDSSYPPNERANPAGLYMEINSNRAYIWRVSFAEDAYLQSGGQQFGQYFGAPYEPWLLDFNKGSLRNEYTYNQQKAKYSAVDGGGNVNLIGVDSDANKIVTLPNGTTKGIQIAQFRADDPAVVQSYFVNFFPESDYNCTGEPLSFNVEIKKGKYSAKADFLYFSDYLAGKGNMAATIILPINPQIPAGKYRIRIGAIDSFGNRTTEFGYFVRMNLTI